MRTCPGFDGTEASHSRTMMLMKNHFFLKKNQGERKEDLNENLTLTLFMPNWVTFLKSCCTLAKKKKKRTKNKILEFNKDKLTKEKKEKKGNKKG